MADGELMRLRGQVQGVGMRPCVARLAHELGLPGWVQNDEAGVLIVLGGAAASRERFVARLLAELPPLARLSKLSRAPTDAAPAHGFSILGSAVADGSSLAVTLAPDASVCQACAQEVCDPAAPRFRYPFTSCTHCGPRFSIVRALPWDRAHTSMAGFALCPACRSEYEDVGDRRYHAEPIACPRCGPQLCLTDAQGRPIDSDPLSHAATQLAAGAIVAVKGLGGFNLFVDATNEHAVARLRSRKRRPDKPFALIARDLQVVAAYAEASASERRALLAPAAPIVLLEAREQAQGRALARALSGPQRPRLARLGFMLPSTPLHLLLLQSFTHPLVCTSGNFSEQPLVIEDREALQQLGAIADLFVGHDRAIEHRLDDSVVRVFSGRARVLRRARGFVPAAIALPEGFAQLAARESVLAAGADLKAVLALSRADDVVLSQQLGDLDGAETRLAYDQARDRFCALFARSPTCIAADNHPEGRAAQLAQAWADERELPCLSVPHHHAHFAACLGENGVPLATAPLFGLVLDGIGAGSEPRSLWGGELFLGGYAHVERVASLEPVALLGGDRAAREPWRCLYAQLHQAGDFAALRARYAGVPGVARLDAKPGALLRTMLETGAHAPRASSCGRLFDAVAAALELCFERQGYEAEAAEALEDLAAPSLARAVEERMRGQYYRVAQRRGEHGPWRLAQGELLLALLDDLASGSAPSLAAARFHVALALGWAELVERLARTRSVERSIALSGGCMQNALLHGRLTSELESLGFRVLSHAEVPAHDGGVALGQVLVALATKASDDGR
jgi:hydrogenase maturation protein HypF